MFTLYDLIEKITGDSYIEVFEENNKCVLLGLAYENFKKKQVDAIIVSMV